MKRMFLEKLFPSPKITSIRKEICGIRQHSGETLYKYWKRFNKLCGTCPHDQISNTQQFGVRGLVAFTVVNKVVTNNQRLKDKITELTSLNDTSPLAKVCGICASIEHPTNAYPTLQETEPNSAEAATMMGGQFWKVSFIKHSKSTRKCQYQNLEEWQRAPITVGNIQNY
ncbi:hypothetical protein CR513_09232, partial [Mucuna pruriens]